MRYKPHWFETLFGLILIFLISGVAHTAPLTISASGDPTVTGSGVGAVALWSNAGNVGGTAIDLRATVTAFNGATNPTFATRNTDDPSVFLGSTGSVTLHWEVFQAGTNQTVTAVGDLNFQVSDIDGENGNPDTRETLTIDLSRLLSYTVDNPTNLVTNTVGSNLLVSGTTDQNNEVTSMVGLNWSNVSNWDIKYEYFENTGARFNHDGDGDFTFSTPVTTVVDTIAPVVATTSAPTATAANQAAYPVSGTCTAGDGNVTVSIAGATPASNSVVCTPAGTWSTTFNVSGIPDGTNVIDVNASQTDVAGNTGNAPLVEASKDATAPVVATTSAPTATAANAATYPVSGTCTAGDGNVTVSISGATPASQSVACTAAGTWSATFNVSAIADGPNVISVNASQTDAAGNTGNAPLVQADKTAGAPAVATTSAPTATLANQAAYPVSGTCSTSAGNVTVSIAGATPPSQSVACTAGGTWSATFNVTAIPDGVKVIDVNASQTDASGTTGNAPLVEADKNTGAGGALTVAILNAPAQTSGPYNVTFEFNRDVAGFVIGDIVVGNGSASNFIAVDGNTYTATITPDGNGDITVDVPAAVAQDALGNNNTAAVQAVTILNDDADGDGIPDKVECPAGPPFDATCPDTDGDGTPDFRDKDSDGDGVPDSVEAGPNPATPVDNDNDGKPDYLDPDSDNDGIPDKFEGGASGRDTDGDGIDDTYDVDQTGGTDANGDGTDDNVKPRDTDGDGTPDLLDLDSDGDGIPDAIEGGGSGTDTDGDGIDDNFDADQTGGVDANGDGIDDAVKPTDTDSDGTPDYLDLDSDRDGIPDRIEADTTGVDTDGDGIDDLYDVNQTGGTDANGDGIDDAVNPTDTDGDTVPDFRDLDTDNDSRPDAQEAPNQDANQDGLLDPGGTTTIPPVDTDGDGIADYRDVDSNNDGTNDIVDEGNGGHDPDGNGMADSPTDTDGDGIPDVIDGEPNKYGTNADADGDGVPNNIDLDDDNDGIPDLAEQTGGADVDTDGDGIADRLDLDSDHDGLPDSIEGVTGTPVDANADGVIDNFVDTNGDGLHDSVSPDLDPVDTDADGTDDIRDIDTDNDGLTDVHEASAANTSLDTNGDGKIDTTADFDLDGLADTVDPVVPGGTSGNALPNPDSDGDGLADFRDPDMDSGSDTDNTPLETAVSGSGGSFGVIGLLLLALLFLRNPKVNVLKRRAAFVVMAILAFPVVSQAETNYCGRHSPPANEFNQCYYIGAGVLVSHVDPEGNTGGWSTSDDSDAGFNVMAGWHFKPHWFVEAGYADLGDAGISNSNPAITNSESISYDVFYLHAGYLLREPENSLNAYGKLGVSGISNDASSPVVPFEEQTSAQVSFGVGLQWRAQTSGLFARLGAEFYDRDAISAGLTVGYGFGGAKPPPKPAKPPPPPPKVVAPQPVVKDSDGDGYPDDVDKCPHSRPGAVVDHTGCEVHVLAETLGVLEGVNFHTGSARLTLNAKNVLKGVAKELMDHPEAKVNIVGHTDSQGSTTSNERLSIRRANSVKIYLEQRGVSPFQMRATGMGEEEPIADNSTKKGRAINRRVELLPQ